MVKIKVPHRYFLLQWSPTLYVCENEIFVILDTNIGDGENFLIFTSYPKPSFESKFEKLTSQKNLSIFLRPDFEKIFLRGGWLNKKSLLIR